MGRGLIGLGQLALALAFAAPVALLGMRFLFAGEALWGGTFLFVAAGMLAVEEWLTTPGDLPTVLLERVTNRVVESPEDET